MTTVVAPPGTPKSQAMPSRSASRVADRAHDRVPFPDKRASKRNPRPSLIAVGIGSWLPTLTSAIRLEVSVFTTEMVFESLLRM